MCKYVIFYLGNKKPTPKGEWVIIIILNILLNLRFIKQVNS